MEGKVTVYNVFSFPSNRLLGGFSTEEKAQAYIHRTATESYESLKQQFNELKARLPNWFTLEYNLREYYIRPMRIDEKENS